MTGGDWTQSPISPTARPKTEDPRCDTSHCCARVPERTDCRPITSAFWTVSSLRHSRFLGGPTGQAGGGSNRRPAFGSGGEGFGEPGGGIGPVAFGGGRR